MRATRYVLLAMLSCFLLTGAAPAPDTLAPIFDYARELAMRAESPAARYDHLRSIALGALEAERTDLAVHYFQLAAEQADGSEQRARLLRVLATRCAENGLARTARGLTERLDDPALRAGALIEVAEGLPEQTDLRLVADMLAHAAKAARGAAEAGERAALLSRTAGAYASIGGMDKAGELFEEAHAAAVNLQEGAQADETYAWTVCGRAWNRRMARARTSTGRPPGPRGARWTRSTGYRPSDGGCRNRPICATNLY